MKKKEKELESRIKNYTYTFTMMFDNLAKVKRLEELEKLRGETSA